DPSSTSVSTPSSRRFSSGSRAVGSTSMRRSWVSAGSAAMSRHTRRPSGPRAPVTATTVMPPPRCGGARGTLGSSAYDALVSDSGPFGPDDDRPDPFQGLPFFGDLARMVQSQLRGQGPVAWDAAQQLALSIVTEGAHEPNVDPTDRIALEELGRVAELQVAAATGLRTSRTGSGVRVTAVNRVQWVQETLRAYRPRFERLAESLPKPDATPPDPSL